MDMRSKPSPSGLLVYYSYFPLKSQSDFKK